jgi:hypothetical protein
VRVVSKPAILLAFGLVIIVSRGACGATEHAGPRAIDPSLVLVSSLDAREELLLLDQGDQGGAGDAQNASRMFLFSLAVPGAGQLVEGHKRGFLYLAAEAAFWTGFFILNGDGLDKRDAYEDFADVRWDYYGYQDFYTHTCGDTLFDPAQGCRPLAPYGSQEFYEDIGKYEVYWDWWIVDPSGGPTSPRGVRDVYWEMRKDSNRDLRNARYFVTAAFLNHLVSAVDAFLAARGGRSSPGHAGRGLPLEFGVADAGGGLSCTVVMRY